MPAGGQNDEAIHLFAGLGGERQALMLVQHGVVIQAQPGVGGGGWARTQVGGGVSQTILAAMWAGGTGITGVELQLCAPVCALHAHTDRGLGA